MDTRLKKKFAECFMSTSLKIFEDDVNMLYDEGGQASLDLALTLFTTRVTKMIEENRLYCLTLGFTPHDLEDAFMASVQDAIKVHRINDFLADYLADKLRTKEDGKEES